MDTPKKTYAFLNKEILTYLVLTICSFFVLTAFVDLAPRVDENFFFSSSDPQLQQEKRISNLFQRKDTQLIISIQGQIDSPKYAKKIQGLSQEITSVPGVISVVSLTEGPKNISDALYSPFWKRLLVTDDRHASNVIVVLENTDTGDTVTAIERLVQQANAKDFIGLISGMPYIVRLIQRHLVHDFATFSLLAFLMFSCVILVIFRSLRVLLGTLVCSLNAGMWTLMITDLLHIQIGLLTANLATVVFVLTLSPIVFLTYNWQHLPFAQADGDRVKQTIRYTLTPSFWSMTTTFLGFLSLLTVPAKPLRELGISGAIGTLVAFGTAYIIYPVFLKNIPPRKDQSHFIEDVARGAYLLLKKIKNLVPLFLIGLGILAIPGLRMIDSDPSIFSYFKNKSDIYKGLDYIDHSGGSNPLIIVLRDKAGAKLSTTSIYKRLWDVQIALENHKDVGTVLSLPVLMAQAKKPPLTFFVSWEWLLSTLESPKYGEISKSFISDNRQLGVFLLRMKESGRKNKRLEIVEQLKKIIEENGFAMESAGGIYALQGHMSKQVISSLIYGVGNLLLIFFVINWLVSASLRIGLAMTVSFSFIPLVVLGIIGWLKIPLDVVSAPAVNVAIGMGIDSVLHTVRYWRWTRKNYGSEEECWDETRKYMWRPVINAMTVVILGFAIFLFSQFPPTQRFGAAMITGAILSIFASLFLIPWLALALAAIPNRKTAP